MRKKHGLGNHEPGNILLYINHAKQMQQEPLIRIFFFFSGGGDGFIGIVRKTSKNCLNKLPFSQGFTSDFLRPLVVTM